MVFQPQEFDPRTDSRGIPKSGPRKSCIILRKSVMNTKLFASALILAVITAGRISCLGQEVKAIDIPKIPVHDTVHINTPAIPAHDTMPTSIPMNPAIPVHETLPADIPATPAIPAHDTVPINILVIPAIPAPDTVHTAQNSLDWSGAYRGILPATDAEGIETIVILHPDLTYTYYTKYLGTNDSIYRREGRFTWRQDQEPVIVLIDNPEGNRYYFVSEGALYHLDRHAKRITGENAEHYRLQKMEEKLTDRYWELTDLEGEKIRLDPSFPRNVYLCFMSEGHRVTGSAGCNRVMGDFEVNGENLKFGHMASTMMACPNMETETKFLLMLPNVSKFSVHNDHMELRDAEGKELAKFVMVLL